MLLPGLKPKKLDPRVDFAPEEFRKEIWAKGLRLRWEMAAECPCGRVLSAGGLTGGTREKRTDCPGCGGRGRVYHSAQVVPGIVSSADKKPERFALYGEFAHGMVRITLLPEHMPTFLDRFTLLDSVLVYTEVRTRKATIESLRYPVVTRQLALGTLDEPETKVEASVGVLYAARAGLDGTLVVDGQGHPVELRQGVDFAVTEAGHVDWTPGDVLGTAPAVGAQVAMHYFAHPVYVVRSHPYGFRDTVVKTKGEATVVHLPVHADCWLEFMGES